MTTPMKPAIRYPAGPITPHGGYHLLKGTHPGVKLTAYDGSVVFDIMGPKAINDRFCAPETVMIEELSGLIAPWQTIDQKGATEDGVTFLDALYDPIEVDAKVMIRGRDAVHTARVRRHLIDSIDAIKTSELSWQTQDLGYWWAPIRWFKTPPDQYTGGQKRRQRLSLVWRADNGFWRSFDDVDQFKLTFDAVVDAFAYETTSGLGGDWTVAHDGNGPFIRADGSQAVLADDPARPVLGEGRDVVCRRTGFTTSGDNQYVEITIGGFSSWTIPDGAYNDVWFRMANTGTPGLDGGRLRVGSGRARLSFFDNGVETVLREQPLRVPVLMPGEKFAVAAGYDYNTRLFKVFRNGIEVQGMSVVESGTGSHVGAAYRGVGCGMHADPGAFPAAVDRFTAGTHSPTTQTGFLRRINHGDQPRYDNFTFFGPGTLYVADTPGSLDFVQFGPLLPNQVMQVRTNPNKATGVVDMTSTPPSPQEAKEFEKAVADFVSFASANNAPPLLNSIKSPFGVQAPQGNPYTLLHGRFRTPLPPKSPGYPAQQLHLACKIEGGNADSAILATGTPLRRFPI